MEKVIKVGNQDVTFKATAATPRMYRQAFGRDIYLDLSKVASEVSEGDENDSNLAPETLAIFENLAFCMAMQAEGKKMNRDTIEDDMTEWLDSFETFSIYRIIPGLMSLWRLSSETTVQPKN